ncbi:DUF4097 family beta strand repeat protein [Marinifilum sp. N1E240]|uniref:DUF4097 family beta strand repeat-containing protein n=1 Tax=Marinifilum sp. N1E240 TaxID=2608082 RepID=UPI00128DDCA5|nr:DUF4097 family beta strand repeat-containing protein [Marinifilum sp. N1E240]MPQ47483.1 DUF4097 family beta strand repeat protein [Marinifilum sp. N1E240]
MKIYKKIKPIFLLLVFMLGSYSLFSQTIFADANETYKGVKSIELKGSFCDVEINGEDRSDVRFEGVIKGKSSKKKKFAIRHELNGGVLSIWIESPNSFYGNINGELSLKVPSDIKLNIRNSSGDLYCENIVSRYSKFRASSGDLNIQKIKGDLDIVTSSGEILVKDLIGNLTSESSSGDQEIKYIVGNVTSKASSGDLEFKDIEGDIQSRTSSGDIEIERLTGRLKNVSSSGGIEISDSKTVLHLTTTSGDIQGDNLVLVGESFFDTTSGNVTLSLRNDPDQLSFDLRASSGNLRAGNRTADKKLYMANGDIWIHGKSSSGDQSYR